MTSAGLPFSAYALPMSVLLAATMVALARSARGNAALWYFALTILALGIHMILGIEAEIPDVAVFSMSIKLLASLTLLRGLVLFLSEEPPAWPKWQWVGAIILVSAAASLGLALELMPWANLVMMVGVITFVAYSTIRALQQGETEDRFGWMLIAGACLVWAALELGIGGGAITQAIGRGSMGTYFGPDLLGLVTLLVTIALSLGLIVLILKSDSRNLRMVMDRMSADSMLDPITGLLNRKGLIIRLSEMIALYRRAGVESSVILIELARFPHAENKLGNLWANNALALIATKLAQSIRGYDVLAHLGDGRFLVILPHSDIIPAMNKANLLRQNSHSVFLEAPVGPTPMEVVALVTLTKTIDQTADGLVSRMEKVLNALPEGNSQQALVI